MEQWRERGFVPDSDEEEEFELLESKQPTQTIEGPVTTCASVPPDDGKHADDDDDGLRGAPEEPQIDRLVAVLIQPHRQPRQCGPQEIGDLEDDPLQANVSLCSRSNKATNTPSIPQPHAGVLSLEDPSSSPDELQFEEHISPHVPATPTRKSPTTPTGLHLDSPDSSPLTSPPSTICSPFSPRIGDPPRSQNAQTPDLPNANAENIIFEDISGNDIVPDFAQHGRALRQRNAIQLHPYLLENAQYQRLLKARGLQPVRVHTNDHAPQKESDGSQIQSYQDENVPPSSSPNVSFECPPSSPGMTGQIQSRASLSPPPVNPSCLIVNRHSGRKYTSKVIRTFDTHRNLLRNKRRKILDESTEGSSNLTGTPDNKANTAANPNIRSINESDSANIFDIPLSPPPSGSLSSAHSNNEQQNTAQSRLPRDITPIAIVTPVTDPRPRAKTIQELLAEFLSEPESDDSSEIHELPVNIGSSPEAPESRYSPELRRMKRKIKGVLPASWLRLDLQDHEKRAKETSKKTAASSHREKENAKGVARKIERGRTSRSDDNPNAFLISDESSSDVELVHAFRSSHETATKKPNAIELLMMGQDQDDDIPEDNRIDYMFPPKPRRRGGIGGRAAVGPRKRRKENDNAAIRTMRRSSQATIRSPNITNTRPRTQHRPPQVARLSILDLPAFEKGGPIMPPQFLRVAARRARKRRDNARQSPNRKYFRLDNKNDTVDVNETLRQWRAGTIPQNTPNRAPQSTSRQAIANSKITGYSTPIESCDNSREKALVGEPAETDVDLTSNHSNITSLNSKRPSKPRFNQSRLARHGFVVSSFKRHVPRSAEVNDSRETPSKKQAPGLFQKTLSALNADYRRVRKGNRFPLERIISLKQNAEHKSIGPIVPPGISGTVSQRLPTSNNPVKKVRKPKKRIPRHIDADAVEYRQPPQHDFEPVQALSVWSEETNELHSLKGLRTAQSYTIDFDTFPLQIGTYFHESTFVGSGKFSRSLNIHIRDLDVDCGHSLIVYDNHTYRWGPWNDTIYSELELLLEKVFLGPTGFDTSSTSACSQATHILESIVLFINQNLSFSDPVDRKLFVDRCLSLLVEGSRLDIFATQCADDILYRLRVGMYSLVLANQVHQVASHQLIAQMKLSEVYRVIQDISSQIFQIVLSVPGISCVRRFLEDNKRLENRETGIRGQYPFMEAYLVAMHITRGQNLPGKTLTDNSLTKAFLASFTINESAVDIRNFEQAWHSLFSILPLQELNDLGIYCVGLRFKDYHDNWSVVTRLISRILGVFNESHAIQSPHFTRYIKALFHRCFHLIKGWGWRSCKPILEILFDLFAGNQFHNLHHETVYGSPKFLDDLDRPVVFEVNESRDTCFQIFLKIAGFGLRSMATIQEKKQLRNIAWRLLPNHGRVYPKEQPLRQEDLNALRNHHDLLCTLYWAVPDDCRPRLETIRHLVHPMTSHKEACSINLQSWSRLVRFKLSTNECDSGLVEFASWHTDYTVEMLKQHALARTELENANIPASVFDQRSIENAIGKNQRQIESLINGALGGVIGALEAARTLSQGKILIEQLPLEKLFSLFDPSVKRLNSVVCQILDLLSAYGAIETRQAEKSRTVVDTSEDSQDYGDWTGFDEICSQQAKAVDPAISYVNTDIRPTLSRFISRIFGEELIPDDSLLVKTIHTWIDVARLLVRYQITQWSSYLSPYNGDSWASLRITDQTRRFMPYFLATLIQSGPGAFTECRNQILNYWIESLAERGSMLKFQHILSTAILNEDVEDPLLKNLPFSAGRVDGKYQISLEEFCQRRVLLISCLLSNMREHLTELEEGNDVDMNMSGQYCEMIQTLMATMRRNYEELGSPNGPLHGAYVDFVHKVVEFLQEHSQGICQIDEFFLDPSTFPLPASDPTYVVAKMRSYGVRLSVAKIAKQLVMFVQNVSERAAVDGHQMYLVDQLFKAMDHKYSDKDYRQPCLRSFFLQCVLPVYVESAFSSPVGWILVRPLLQATTRVFMDILLDVNTANDQYVSLIEGSLMTYFNSVSHAFRLLTDHPGLLEEPPVLLALISLLETIIASLAAIDFFYRISERAAPLLHYVEYFKQFLFFAVTSLLDPSAAREPCFVDVAPATITDTPTFFHGVREFATKQLQIWLKNDWSLHNGQYFVRRGTQNKRVDVDPSCLTGDLAKTQFMATVEVFFGAIDRLWTFSSTAL
ncbi:hypothetical protein LOZ57_002876 [Ophidiomyces ophidiicola]|uniref:uncharacterized protein n=1 Tax=Ophidiomyces ophidiicola TaxID=1387563 RepID=UPI0020C1BE81|nr:uncharacterized protein LOZ57_002876 [Ophidiomyces ophidiicola]KAI1948520.1 hypothetical protein LOZ57_002876 [Ophidiomyces ophidiicola]KAI2061875.1 hypothetical protein LOZ43_000830 [Ophidiomyces ophidiicola]